MAEMVKATNMVETDEGIQITLALNAEAVGRIRESQKFFHDEKSIDSKIAEMMTFCIVKFTKS